MKPDAFRMPAMRDRRVARLPIATGLALALTTAALLGGCASAPSPPPQTQAPLVIAGQTPQAILSRGEVRRVASAIPADHRKSVIRAEAFGRTIRAYDRLARQAGRQIAPNGQAPFNYPPVGWLTERAKGGLRLSFIVKEKTTLGVAAEVTRTEAGLAGRRITPPRSLTPREIILWKARQIAYSSKFKPCSKRYNPVVVPVQVEGERFIDVFLLPTSANPHTIYLGGYQRVAVSPDGNAVLEAHSFTHGCITLHAKGRTAGARVTEIVSDTPTAPQVYASLRYGLPIQVKTVGNGLSWLVENGRISLQRKQASGRSDSTAPRRAALENTHD